MGLQETSPIDPWSIAIASICLYCFWRSSVYVIRDYERIHVFRLGKLVGVREPGICFLWPIFYQVVRTDLRLRSASVNKQQVMTKDNLSMHISAFFFYQVTNPSGCWGNPAGWVLPVIQASLFTAAGEFEFQTIVGDPESFKRRVFELCQARMQGWAVTITDVSVSGMSVSLDMMNGLAKTALAERERRAKIIQAEGDCQSAPILAKAAAIMSSAPGTMALRQIQTMELISKEQNTSLIFPLVCDIGDPALKGREEAV